MYMEAVGKGRRARGSQYTARRRPSEAAQEEVWCVFCVNLGVNCLLNVG